MNRTLIANYLQPNVLHLILENYGSPYLGYDEIGGFYAVCNDLSALAIVGDIPSYISVNNVPVNFPSTISTFLFLRWDAYDGGFADDLYYGQGVPGLTPREIVPSIEATYVSAQLMNELGVNLFTPSGPYNPNPEAFAGLCARSQTEYGYFKESPSDYGNPTFQIDVNYYAVSLLTLVNRTHILDEGHFRWPSGAQTPIENLAETGYLLPLIAVIVILPILTVALLEYRLYRRPHTESHIS